MMLPEKTHYNIAFCGLGSIGTRHLRNIVKVLEGRGYTYNIYAYRHDPTAPLPEDIAPLITEVYPADKPLPKKLRYDIVFVTNPTSLHYATLEKFAGHSSSFFVEKPVFHTAEVDTNIFKRLFPATSYVACPLRYNPVLQYIKKNIHTRSALSVRAISSSYLPDWRPGQDYRQTYSAHRDMGGGVGIDLIHEWDYLTWLFDEPDTWGSIQKHISSLEIDSEDIAIYIGANKHTTFEVHLDYFGRAPMRRLEIFLPEETILCDLLAGTIHFLNSGRKVTLNSERNDYQLKELEHFMDILALKTLDFNSLEDAYNVLKIATQ